MILVISNIKMPNVLCLVAVFIFLSCSNTSELKTNNPKNINLDHDSQLGSIAPNFKMTVFGNANHTMHDIVELSHFMGKPVVINFWYPSCPPCRVEIPDFQATYEKYEQNEIEFMGVMLLGLDTLEEGQQFVNDFGITYAIGPDTSNIIIDYQVVGFPTTMFLNRDHKIVHTWTGTLSGKRLEELVQELIQ